jgi:NAD(P)-dependent dehydrogenase (short-subunit alcohol dehydrogenase family)
MRLKDKVTVVTGAGAGIGKSISEIFAREGAKVVVSSRRVSNGQPVADNIIKNGGEAIFVRCDVSIEEDVKQLIAKTLEVYGRIDVLVNNAGVNYVNSFENVKPDDWDRVINTDLRGTYLCSWYAIPYMLKQGKGNIINITTVHTLACVPGAAPYDAAKWGMVGLTKSLAVEFASRNIRINALSPGLIDTQIWDDLKAAAPDLDACLSFWKSNIPAGRVGTPEEIAYTAVFLASDEAGYITGANILADGGMTSQLISSEPFKSKSIEGSSRG